MTIKDFYKEYKNSKRDGKSLKGVLDYKTYKKIIESFFLAIAKKMIYENFTFMMPYSLGSVLVKAFKSNLKNPSMGSIDWNRTKQLGKVVRHLNTHTFGYYFGIMWDKSYVRFRNNAYYIFKAPSSLKATKAGVGKKALSQHIISLSKDPNKKSFIKI